MRLRSSSAGGPVGGRLATGALRSGQGIVAFDFAAAASSSGVFTAPPPWLSIACATTGRTVQTGVATVVSGIGANAWRARNAGSGLGLSVESSVTCANGNSVNGITGWSAVLGAAMVTTTGPDGVAGKGIAATWTTGAPSVVEDDAVVGAGAYQIQVWAQGVGGTTQIDYVDNSMGAWNGTLHGLSASWARFDAHVSSSSVAVLGLGDFVSALAGSANLWGASLVTGATYPSSTVPTTGSPRTRAADVLSTGAPIAPSGRLNMAMKFAPNFATAEQQGDSPLLWWDASNQVFLRQSDGKVVVKVGGSVALTSSALTWSREQGLTVAVHLSPTRALSLAVAGATTGNGTTTASSVAAFTTAATAYLLGTNAGGRECNDLRRVAFLTP